MDKKYIPSALVLYLNYFIHGIGCSILSQQVVKEMLASQWGLKDVMAVTSIAAALGLGRLIRFLPGEQLHAGQIAHERKNFGPGFIGRFTVLRGHSHQTQQLLM